MIAACSDTQQSDDMEATKKYCDATGGRFVEGKGCLAAGKIESTCSDLGMKYDAELEACVDGKVEKICEELGMKYDSSLPGCVNL
jgi:hypothetical protein